MTAVLLPEPLWELIAPLLARTSAATEWWTASSL
jgi:hypothetical protein